MKKIILSLLLAITALTAVAAKQKTVVWNEPQAIYKSGAIIRITTVEMKPQETVLHVNIKFHPKYWIRFNSKDMLIDETGRHYAILSGTHTCTGETDVPLDDYFWMPESGEVNVALHFEPLPADTRCFNYKEPGNDENGWAWWNIRDSKEDYRSPIPEEWQRNSYAMDETLPDAKVQKGTATLKVRLLGYKPEMKFGLQIHFMPLNSTGEHFDKKFPFADDGTLTAEVPLYLARSINVAIDEPQIYFRPVLAPGETTEMLIDLNRLKDPFVAFKGFLARTNFESTRPEKTTEKQSQKNAVKLLADIQKQKTPIQRLNFFRKRLDKAIAACNKEHKTSAWKALRRMMYEQDYLSWLVAYPSQYTDLRIGIHYQGRSPHNFEEYDSLSKAFYKECEGKLSYPFGYARDYPEEYAREEKHIADMEILTAPYAPASFDFWRVSWLDDHISGLNHDLQALRSVLENHHVTRDFAKIEKSHIASIKSPAVLAILEEHKAEQERLRQQLNAQAGIFFEKLDSVPPADILQNILDRYKEKVVLIDIWATWCGPCRAGHKQMAPLKDEMSTRDVQFVYITSPSSPLATWQTMIKDIPGDHYYLTREQYDHLLQLYASNGIPTYAIYDRAGNRTWSHVGLTDNNTFRRELENALGKE